MNKVFELIYSVKIFLSPFLIFNVIGIAFFLFDKDLKWLWILLGIAGFILGVFWAVRVRKRKGGATQFIAEICNNDDIASYNELFKDKDNV
jgi:hypothetical protein